MSLYFIMFYVPFVANGPLSVDFYEVIKVVASGPGISDPVPAMYASGECGMIFESIFGTGNLAYERRFGRMERRFVRQCGRQRPPRLRAVMLAAARGAQEMDHWLFLNRHSLFRRHLPALDAALGERLFLTWLAVGVAAQSAFEDLPAGEAEIQGWIHRLLQTEFGAAAASWPERLRQIQDQPDARALRELLRAELAACLPEPPDLEETLTLGILLSQMAEKSISRCRRLLPGG